MKNKSFFLSLFVLFFLIGCGYKPTTVAVKNGIYGSVFIETKKDIHNLNNTILMEDALKKILLGKLDIVLTNKRDEAASYVYGELQSVSESILETDSKGFAKVYRQTVTIFISFHSKENKTKNFTVSNYYDFVVAPDSVITSANKEEAIKQAIEKALSDVFSKIALYTSKG